jgi:hypothetical protein
MPLCPALESDEFRNNTFGSGQIAQAEGIHRTGADWLEELKRYVETGKRSAPFRTTTSFSSIGGASTTLGSLHYSLRVIVDRRH